MFECWIRQQPEFIILEVFNRFSHHLSDRELVHVMEGVKNNRDIIDIHLELGLHCKYSTDLFRIRAVVTENYPTMVVG